MTAGTAIYAPAPAPEWLRLADELGTLDGKIERASLHRCKLAWQMYKAWEMAGRPGGNFGRAVDDHRVARGLKPLGKSNLYAWKDAGEALERGVQVETAQEAAAAGQALKKGIEGRSVQEAVAVVQAQVDAGEFKKKKAGPLEAPQGCTWRAVPLGAADMLDDVLDSIAQLAGEEWPSEKPDRIAALATVLTEHQELQRVLAAPDDWAVVSRAQFELLRGVLADRSIPESRNDGVA